MVTQRLGSLSRVVFYEETAWNEDTGITDGYILPIADQEGFGTDRNLIEAPVYTGDREPRGSILGLIDAAGDIPVGLEFQTIGRILKVFMGEAGYSRVGSLHKYRIAVPGSCQLEKVFTETTPLYIRNSGVTLDQMTFNTEIQGVGRYGLRAMGSGREVYTTLDASPTDEGYDAANYFNGFIKKNGVSLGTVTAFQVALANRVSRQDTAFNAGIAAGLNPGLFAITGQLGLIFDDMTFYNHAVNEDVVTLECMWSNAPLALATKWLRMYINAVKFSRTAPRAGGEAGITITQNYRGQKPSAGRAPEVISGIETFNIGASTNKLGIKVDGGATQEVTLTQGAARTAAQIVSDITGLPLTGGAASVFNTSRVRIASNTVGTGGTIQIDTGVANSAHTVLGFTGTAVSGTAATAIEIELFNAQSSDY